MKVIVLNDTEIRYLLSLLEQGSPNMDTDLTRGAHLEGGG